MRKLISVLHADRKHSDVIGYVPDAGDVVWLEFSAQAGMSRVLQSNYWFPIFGSTTEWLG